MFIKLFTVTATGTDESPGTALVTRPVVVTGTGWECRTWADRSKMEQVVLNIFIININLEFLLIKFRKLKGR